MEQGFHDLLDWRGRVVKAHDLVNFLPSVAVVKHAVYLYILRCTDRIALT